MCLSYQCALLFCWLVFAAVANFWIPLSILTKLLNSRNMYPRSISQRSVENTFSTYDIQTNLFWLCKEMHNKSIRITKDRRILLKCVKANDFCLMFEMEAFSGLFFLRPSDGIPNRWYRSACRLKSMYILGCGAWRTLRLLDQIGMSRPCPAIAKKGKWLVFWYFPIDRMPFSRWSSLLQRHLLEKCSNLNMTATNIYPHKTKMSSWHKRERERSESTNSA